MACLKTSCLIVTGRGPPQPWGNTCAASGEGHVRKQWRCKGHSFPGAEVDFEDFSTVPVTNLICPGISLLQTIAAVTVLI